MKRIVMYGAGAAIALAMLAACSTGAPGGTAAESTMAPPSIAVGLDGPSLTDRCGAVAMAVYHRRLATGPATAMRGAEAALAARQAASDCVAAGLHGGRFPSAGRGRHDDPG